MPDLDGGDGAVGVDLAPVGPGRAAVPAEGSVLDGVLHLPDLDLASERVGLDPIGDDPGLDAGEGRKGRDEQERPHFEFWGCDCIVMKFLCSFDLPDLSAGVSQALDNSSGICYDCVFTLRTLDIVSTNGPLYL